MKYLIILGDGMADEPIAELGNKTPLQAAYTPSLDYLATLSRTGLLSTTPAGFQPGSEIAHLSLLGYDVPKVYEGRGSLEAASIGVEIAPDEMAMRCNLVCIENGKIKNHSAGNISTEEACSLIDTLNENIDELRASFFKGVAYRHLLKIKGGNKDISCTPPHDIPGQDFKHNLVTAADSNAEETASLINKLIQKSHSILENHPINITRIKNGLDPANSIWPWSPGYKPQMELMSQKYDIHKGAVISAVDLINGIGIYAGLTPIRVPNITGLWDTNYIGKANAAIEALKGDYDFVFLHIEASDEAGHDGDVKLKVKTIESLDREICKPIIDSLPEIGTPVSIAILPDHPTPCAIRTHSPAPVPVMIYRPGVSGDNVTNYDENSVRNGTLGIMHGDDFIKEFLQ